MGTSVFRDFWILNTVWDFGTPFLSSQVKIWGKDAPCWPQLLSNFQCHALCFQSATWCFSLVKRLNCHTTYLVAEISLLPSFMHPGSNLFLYFCTPPEGSLKRNAAYMGLKLKRDSKKRLNKAKNDFFLLVFFRSFKHQVWGGGSPKCFHF